MVGPSGDHDPQALRAGPIWGKRARFVRRRHRDSQIGTNRPEETTASDYRLTRSARSPHHVVTVDSVHGSVEGPVPRSGPSPCSGEIRPADQRAGASPASPREATGDLLTHRSSLFDRVSSGRDL